MSFKVQIHLYDLSQGMAKNMSKSFLGIQIDGIWHTGIVVYGKEFYYGGGISQDPPGRTPYGSPIKTIEAGETEIPEEIFLDFLREINPKFTAEKYDLFTNNCNNFSDACAEFLTGTKIPDYITGLPKQVLATPMGQRFKPIIDNMQKNVNQNSHPMFAQEGQQLNNFGGGQNNFGGQNFGGGMNFNNFSQPSQQTASKGQGVISTTNPTEFNALIKNSAAVIVDFFSYTCPPCMKIKPFYERLAQDFGGRCPELKFVSVDTGVARQIAMNYQITSIPTFIAFFEGNQFQRFAGADPKKLESLAYTLESKINSRNGGAKTNGSAAQSYDFLLFNPQKKDFYSFSGANYALPIKSINTVLEGFSTLNQSEIKEIFTRFSENPAENVKQFSTEDKTHLISWIFETAFYIGISDKTIGLLDLTRMLTLDQSYLDLIYKNQDRLQEIFKFFDKTDDALKELPKGLKLVLLRLLTNLTATEKCKTFFQGTLSSFVELLVKVGNVYKDDKAALHPILMTLWNLVQNFHDSKDFDQVIGTIIHFVRIVYNSSIDNEVLLGATLILAWLSFYKKDQRRDIDDKVDKVKLSKLEFAEDNNLNKVSRDFSDILRGKAN